MSWTEWTDSSFRGLNLLELKVDEAYLNVSNARNHHYFLYTLSEECVKCPFKKLKAIAPLKETIIKLEVDRNQEMRLFDQDMGQYVFPNETNGSLVWSHQPELGEFGVYDLRIMESQAIKFEEMKEPVNIYTSLFLVALIIISFYWICKVFNKFYISGSSSAPTPEQSTDNELDETPKTKKRLKSLDIFRGVAIVLMIFVNSGGGKYYWIEHATWNGLHFADLVFPWFLFIMGVCIPMSIKSQINQQIPIKKIVYKVVKRSIILVLLGLSLNTAWGATFGTIRLPGVLQRFGVAYLVVSLIHLAFVTTSVTNVDSRLHRIFYDIKIIWKQWVIVLGIVFVYLVSIFVVKIPSCDRGYMGPGGIHDLIQNQNCTGGVTGLVDRTLLGEAHMYQRARIRKVYDALVFDPEGTFGCLTTILQVFLGVQCGVTLLVFSTYQDRLRRWLAWGVGLATLTAMLTLCSVENGIIPINKNLWSLSFVTVTSSLAFFLLSLIYFLVDVKNIGDDFWTIFLYPGMNAIILYLGHSIFHTMWPFHWQFDVMNTHFILLLENVYTVTVWILIAHRLYHKRIFFNI